MALAPHVLAVLFAIAMWVLAWRESRKSAERLLLVRSGLSAAGVVTMLAFSTVSVVVVILLQNASLVPRREFDFFSGAFIVGMFGLACAVGMKIESRQAIGAITLLEDDWVRVRLDGKETEFLVVSARVMRSHAPPEAFYARYELSDGMITWTFFGALTEELWDELGSELHPNAGTMISGNTDTFYGWVLNRTSAMPTSS